MKILSLLQQYLRKFGFMTTLSFDQQVWGAKSVMDLVQYGSQFFIAQGTAGQSCYTCWLGSRDHVATAIVVESNGKANSPFPDDSHIKDCVAWSYPPKISCAQAVTNMVKAGISESWIGCELKQTTNQKNPTYIFTFAVHPPVAVDATTGKLI